MAPSADGGDGACSSGSHHDSPPPLPPWCKTAKRQHPSAPCMEPEGEGAAEARRGHSDARAATDVICIFARSLEGRSGCWGERVGTKGGTGQRLPLAARLWHFLVFAAEHMCGGTSGPLPGGEQGMLMQMLQMRRDTHPCTVQLQPSACL